MKPPYITPEALGAFVSAALGEDVGEGDHATLSSVPAHAHKKAQAVFKEPGTVAGNELAAFIFQYVDPALKTVLLVPDGGLAAAGQAVFTVEGPARAILTAERLVLNCMQRMSGIATHTRKLASLIEGTGAKLLDTRKTTPNFRLFEKWAVKTGGGENHRMGLFDLIMLKDNHVDFAGGIPQAIGAAAGYREKLGLDIKIEIETRNLDEVAQVLATGQVDIIMLDNMPPTTMKEAVRLIGRRYLTEASGNITQDNIRQTAETGVDFISSGALTHSAGIVDISLKAV